MSVHSIQRKRRRDPARIRYKTMGSHEEFLARITKSLYYGDKLPRTERFSLPVSELCAELFSERAVACRSLDRLRPEQTAEWSRKACVSPCSLVLALLYLDRLKLSNPDFLDSVSPSQLFLVTSLVASKFLEDEEEQVCNSEWAASTDVKVKRVNRLERDLLAAIEWDVMVGAEEFWAGLERLEAGVAAREASKRAWTSLTYTDLVSLLPHSLAPQLATALLSVSAVCLTAYAAGVASLVTSTLLASSLHRTLTCHTTLCPTSLYHDRTDTEMWSGVNVTELDSWLVGDAPPCPAVDSCLRVWEADNPSRGNQSDRERSLVPLIRGHMLESTLPLVVSH